MSDGAARQDGEVAHSGGGTERWEVHLTYPMDSSYSGEATEIVDADSREKAIKKAKRNAGMDSADAYPVYRLSEVGDAE